MSQINFTKMHGCGNDFVVINALNQELPSLSELAISMCKRRFGVGADQLIIIEKATKDEAIFRMEVLNADGSQVEMCGNALRCIALYAVREGIIASDIMTIETPSGVSHVEIAGDAIRIEVGVPSTDPNDIGLNQPGPAIDQPVIIRGACRKMTAISVGNPHAVTFLNDLERFEFNHEGSQYENHTLFKNRANIEFIKVLNKNEVNMRVWERGSGETLACGSGACAAAAAAIINKKCESPLTVHLKGGDLLIEWAGEGEPIYMTGPASFVFDSVWNIED